MFSFKPLQGRVSRMHSVYVLNQIFSNKTSYVQFIYLLQISIRKKLVLLDDVLIIIYSLVSGEKNFPRKAGSQAINTKQILYVHL